jgi:hypothetical protein
MKPHPFLAKIDRRWRARRVTRGLALMAYAHDSQRYYQAIYDYSFFIV